MLSTSSSWAPSDVQSAASTVAFGPVPHMRRVLTPLKARPAADEPLASSVAAAPPAVPSVAAAAPPTSARVEPLPKPLPLSDSAVANRKEQAGGAPCLLRSCPSLAGADVAPGVVPVTSAFLQPLERPPKDLSAANAPTGSDNSAPNTPTRGAKPTKKRRPSRTELLQEVDALWFAVSLMAPYVGRRGLKDIRNRLPLDVERWDAMVQYTCGAASDDGSDHDHDDDEGVAGSPGGSNPRVGSDVRALGESDARATLVPGAGDDCDDFDAAAEYLQARMPQQLSGSVNDRRYHTLFAAAQSSENPTLRPRDGKVARRVSFGALGSCDVSPAPACVVAPCEEGEVAAPAAPAAPPVPTTPSPEASGARRFTRGAPRQQAAPIEIL